MKKKILCFVLALVIFGSAIGFAVYNKYGTTYDYSKKDLTKFLSSITDKNYIQSLYDGSVTLETPSSLDIQYIIASKYKDAGTAKTTGTFGNYDTVTLYYKLTLADGTQISDSKHMLIKNTTDVQIGTDDDLARILASLADTTDISDYSYNIYAAGNIFNGDNLYISYAVQGSDVKGTSERFVYDSTFSLEDVLTGLTDAFKAAASEIEIGTAKTLTVGENTVTVTVDFATRTTVKEIDVATGDILFFSYKTVVAEGEKEETGTFEGQVGSGEIDAAFGTGMETALIGHTMGAWSDEISVVKDGATTKYKVKGSYAIRADLTGIDDSKITKAENFFTVDYTYPADSTAVAETDKTIELKGQTVTLTGYISTFKDVTYDYDSIINTIKYEPGETDVGDIYLTAYADYLKKNETFEAAVIAYNDAETAYNEAVANGESDLTALEAAKTAAQADLDTAATARNSALDVLDEKASAYATEKGMDAADVNGELVAKAVYDAVATSEAQAAKDKEYAKKVAKIVWDKLLAQAKADLAKAGYPSKAVRVAYDEIYDYYETQYYTNSSSTPYSEYSSFKAYLKQYKYAGQDYRAQIKLEAQDVVVYRMLLQHLINIFDVELTTTQIYMIQLYASYSSSSFAVQMQMAYYFDNAMDAIALLVNPDLTLN